MNIQLSAPVKFALAFLFAWLLFYRGFTAAFVSDFAQWAYTYKSLGVSGIPVTFNDISIHHFLHFFSFVWFSIFGLNEIAWGVLQIGLHTLNAILIGGIIARLLKTNGNTYANSAAWVAGALFLFSPYQTEAVIWSAAVHYLMTTAMVLGIITLLMRARPDNLPLTVILVQTIFIVALASLELALMLPFLLLVLFFFFGNRAFPSWSRVGFVLWVVGVQLVIIAGYFALNNVIFGKVIGHYGAATHLNFNPLPLLHNYMIYWVKWTTFWRYWSNADSNKGLLTMLNSAWLIPFIVAMVVGLAYLAYQTYLNNKLRARFLLCFVILTMLALLPVINLQTTSLFQIETDRYGYFASVFFYAFIGVLAVGIYSPWARKGLITAMVLVHVSLLIFTVNKWHQAGNVFHGMVDTFKWQDSPQILVINAADNCDGVYLFRHGFGDIIALYNNDMGLKKRITVVTNYKMLHHKDSITVSAPVLDSLIQASVSPGSWFMGRHGGENESTPPFDVQFFDGNYWLRLDIECLRPGGVVLYQAADQLKEVPTEWMPKCTDF